MSDFDRPDWVVPTQLNVGTGTTLGTFVPIIAGQIYVDLLPLSGGSVFINGWGISRGTTTTLSQKALTPTIIVGISGFPLAYGAVPYRIPGPAAFWLNAPSATTVVALAYGCRNTLNEL
jgi:hypothetical protein